MKKLFILFSLLLIASWAVFAAGIKDPAFGDNGTIQLGASTLIKDIALQPDGKIIIGAFCTSQNGGICLRRLLPNGAVDQSFGNNGSTGFPLLGSSDFAYDLELQADGKIIIAGATLSPLNGTTSDFLVLRLNSNGTPDTSFANNGVFTLNQDQEDRFLEAKVQPDGKIVAVGSALPSITDVAVMRFNPNGTLDQDFGSGGAIYHTLQPQGPSFYSAPSDIEVLPDGKLLCGGPLNQDFSGANFRGSYLMRLNPDGSRDLSFGPQGLAARTSDISSAPGLAFDMEKLADGSIAMIDGRGITFRLLQSGNEVFFSQDGERVVSLEGSNAASIGGWRGGNIKVHTQRAFIGWDFISGFSEKIPAGQPDGLLLLGENSPGQSRLTRYLRFTSQATRQPNFNNYTTAAAILDSYSDMAVYRPSDRSLRVITGNGRTIIRSFSSPATKIFPEFLNFATANFSSFPETLLYWNNGAQGGPAFFRYERFSGDSSFISQDWGLAGDIPYGGDFNGDGLLDAGLFRNGAWWGLNANGYANWGAAGDKPVPADYDYDGKTDFAIYRPSSGSWWIRRSSDGSASVFQFGIASDIPITGDYDADGKADLTLYRPSEGIWYQLLTSEGFRALRFGLPSDIPLSGDYDGDGRHDIALYRNGTWYFLMSGLGLVVRSLGEAGDIPVSARYDQ